MKIENGFLPAALLCRCAVESKRARLVAWLLGKVCILFRQMALLSRLAV